jgi:hypothetical protein
MSFSKGFFNYSLLFVLFYTAKGALFICPKWVKANKLLRKKRAPETPVCLQAGKRHDFVPNKLGID